MLLTGSVGPISHYYLVGIEQALDDIDIEEDEAAAAAAAAVLATTATATATAPVITTTITTPDPTATGQIRATTISWADVVAGRHAASHADVQGPSTAPVVRTVMVPNYYNLWAEFYGEDRFSSPYDAAALARLEAEHGEITARDIDSAINGDDGIDPISFWNFAAAPKPMLEIAGQHEKQIVHDKVLGWNDDGVLEEGDGMEVEDETTAVRNTDVVDVWVVDDIAFGEEACKGL